MLTRIAMTLLACSAAMTSAHAQRPWLAADSRLEHDSQSRTALRLDAQHGRYLTPALTAGLQVGVSHIAAPGISTSSGSASLSGTLGIAPIRLGLEASAGVAGGLPGDDAVVPVFMASSSLNLGAGVAVRGRAVRERYTATVASLDTALLSTRVEFALDRSAAPGWAGEAVVRRETFGDGNPISTAYAWLLAPVSRATGHALRVGYGAAWQDTPESRWVMDPGNIPGGPGGPPRELRGRYAPYYTPHDVVTHSGLANAAVAMGAAWLIADGSVGVHATELAPVLFGSPIGGEPVELTFYERRFTPWRSSLSLVTPIGGETLLTAAAEFSRSAYYRTGGVRLSLSRWL